jgi:hypothetical protein
MIVEERSPGLRGRLSVTGRNFPTRSEQYFSD